MNERLSLQDLIDLLAKKQEITKKEAEIFLRELIAVISENIENNEPVKVKDFGTFKLVKVNARKSVDVNTGEAIEIAAHYKLSFTPDKLLKETINRPFAHFESVILEEGVSFDNIEKEEDLKAEEIEEEDVSVDEEVHELAAAIPLAVSLEEDKTEAPVTVVTQAETIENIIKDEVKEEVTSPQQITEEVIEEEIVEYIPITETVNDNQRLENTITEDDTESVQKIIPDETENVIPQSPINHTDDTPDEGDLEYERKVEEQRKAGRRRRKLVSLGFYIFLILAGFLIGGIYFQKITGFLSENFSKNINTTATVSSEQEKDPKDDLVLPPDTLSQSEKQDSIAATVAIKDTLSSTEKVKQPEQPKTDKPTIANTTVALATVTIEPGSTLRNIALKYYGHKSFCVYIYEENKNNIKNINSIPLGTKLVIPSPTKYGINSKDRASIEKAKEKERKLYIEMGL